MLFAGIKWIYATFMCATIYYAKVFFILFLDFK